MISRALSILDRLTKNVWLQLAACALMSGAAGTGSSTAWANPGGAAVGFGPGDWRTDVIPEAEFEGASECLSCHTAIREATLPAFHSDCEGCHGAGSLHNETESLQDIRFPGSEDCLGCHEEGSASHLEWRTSAHATGGLICADCHNTHNRSDQNVRSTPAATRLMRELDSQSAVCVNCHSDVAARLGMPSHHPIREGALECAQCHDPHGDSLAVVADSSEQCSGCHQDYMGPWVFEHVPAVEDCTSCHDAHGSPMRNLLSMSQPVLCLQCHSLSDDRHQGPEFNLGGTVISQDNPTGTQAFMPGEAGVFECTNCHGAIHGSHFDKHLRR